MPLNPIQQNLVETHLPLVHNHLNRNVPTPNAPTRDREYADLFQEGCIGLITAAQAYRPARDGTFTAFALPRIRLAVHRALHEKFATVRIPENARRAHRLTAERKAHSPQKNPSPFAAVRALRDDDHLADPASKNPRPPSAVDRGSLFNPPTIAARVDTVIRLTVESVRLEFRRRHHNRPERLALIDRIIRERVLIPDPPGRESLRSIGHPLGLAAGQVLRYEQRILGRIRDRLQHHAEFQACLTLARQAEHGFQTELTPTRRADPNRFELSTRHPNLNTRNPERTPDHRAPQKPSTPNAAWEVFGEDQ
jgi:RNA polymerase primary sigma factor